METKKIYLLSALTLPAMAVAQGRYNVVYIMTDDHTAQMMSCYDNRNVETPNLDRIAADGVKFVNSFVANSISGPSRACMLTGKHSHKNGFTNNEHGVFDGSQQTMPKLLQEAGYQTAIIGKWHLVSTPTGFDFWNILPAQGDYYNPNFITMENKTVREKGYVTNIITDKSIDWLEHKRDRSKPFALFVHHKACHRAWLPELKYLNLYEDKTFPLPETFYDDYEGRPAAAAQEMSIAKDMDMAYDVKMYTKGVTKTPLAPTYEGMIGRLDPEDRAKYDAFYNKLTADFESKHLTGKALAEFKFQRYMRDYAKVLKSLDDNVGRLLDYLDESGLLDSTLVVYTSDQGFYMGEHGWFDKRFIYEESFRMPFIVRYPEKIKPGTDITNFIANIDFAPTLLDFCGVEAPEAMQGKSYRKMLTGEDTTALRDAVYYHYYEYPLWHHVQPHYGVRTDRYVMAHFYYDIDVWELFDLEKDPNELNNVYNDPAYADVREALHKRLGELQQEFGDDISLEEYRYITATNFREVSEDYYKKGDNSLNAPRKEASKKR